MGSYLSDLLHATRTLVKARAFTAVCVTSLGLGMGVVIGVMLLTRIVVGTPPGVDDDGLVELVIRPSGALRAEAGSAIIDTWSLPDFLDVREGARSGLVVTGWSRGDGIFRPADRGATIPAPTMYVSSNYFSTIGVTLARGRGFTPADDASLAEAEAVISYRLWQLRFGSDPDIIGRAITVNQTDYVVVGVTQERFRGHIGSLDDSVTSLFLPLSRHPRLMADENVRFDRGDRWVRALARLAPGTTLPQADATVQSVMAGLAARYPASHEQMAAGVEPYFAAGARLRSQISFARLMLFGLAGLVLLVVGLNISGMMLVRSAMRERELAVRLALGSSRWRLMQYHLSEALVMAVLGGSVASAVLFGAPVVIAWALDFSGPALDLFKPDVWLALQCLALCFVTSLILGLLPALRFSRPSVLSALKNDSAGSGRRVGRLQRLTAALQAGLAVPILVIGGIHLDRARVTAMANVGFTPQGLYTARFNLPAIGRNEDDRQRFVQTVRANLAQAPSLVSVSVGDGLPLDFNERDTRVARERESTFVAAHTTRIESGYLETLGIRLLAGRGIEQGDQPGAERVVVLSEPLARQLFAHINPLGERVVFELSGHERQTYTVVGVTADLVSTQMGNPRPQLFVSLAQHPASTVFVIARGTPDDPSVRRAFEHAIANADSEVVLGAIMTGEGLIERSRSDLLTSSIVSAGAATIALALAALGVYGVIAFMVAMRTREIGVRVALGASRARVLKDVLGDALQLVVPGIGVGLLLAVLWTRVVDPSWYSHGAVEPLVYTFAAAIAFTVAVLAGIPSARRAAAVQPIVAIRTE